MTYALVHVEDPPARLYDWRTTDPEMDVSILVPGAEKVCTVVPLAALRMFLPLLHDALGGSDAEPLRCEACGEVMDVPVVDRPTPPLALGEAPSRLGEAIARRLAGKG